MLTVYGRPNSSNSAKVFWLLDELGLDYRLVPTGRGFAPADSPEFLAMNPFGKVLVVQNGDVAVWESNAVLRWLADRHGPSSLWPRDAAERSMVDRWMDWASIALTPPLTRLRKARAAGRSDDADLPAVKAMDRRLSGRDFLAGEALSLADITAAPAVHRWFLLPESRDVLPVLAAYAGRLAARAGHARHIAGPLS